MNKDVVTKFTKDEVQIIINNKFNFTRDHKHTDENRYLLPNKFMKFKYNS